MENVISVVAEVAVSIVIVVVIVCVCYCCCCKKTKPPIPPKPAHVPLEKDPTLTEITSVDSNTNGIYRYVMGGGWYEGPLVNGVMEGQGKFCYNDNGGTYVGGFKEGHRHGEGVYSNVKERWEGIFVNDKGTEGTYWMPDGTRQMGQFVGNFLLNGHGLEVSSDGAVSEGEFLNGLANGKMKETLRSGNIFNGMIYQEKVDGVTRTRGEGSLYVVGKWKYHGGLSCSKTDYTVRVRVWDRNEPGNVYYDEI